MLAFNSDDPTALKWTVLFNVNQTIINKKILVDRIEHTGTHMPVILVLLYLSFRQPQARHIGRPMLVIQVDLCSSYRQTHARHCSSYRQTQARLIGTPILAFKVDLCLLQRRQYSTSNFSHLRQENFIAQIILIQGKKRYLRNKEKEICTFLSRNPLFV